MDKINSPDHYKLSGLDIEAKDVIRSVIGEEPFRSYCYGNIIKYVLRANKKNGYEDLLKAKRYIEILGGE